MSPGVLAGMWKEAEKKTKQLEERIKVILKEKGVCVTFINFIGWCSLLFIWCTLLFQNL